MNQLESGEKDPLGLLGMLSGVFTKDQLIDGEWPINQDLTGQARLVNTLLELNMMLLTIPWSKEKLPLLGNSMELS